MTMGTDPEVFVLDENGNPVPAWKFFPDKEHRKPGPKYACGHYRGGGSYYRDGYALEFNTTPSSCREILYYEMGVLLNMAKAELPEGYTLTTKTTVKIDPGTLVDVPSDCQVFGCDPSIDAYTGEERRPDVDPMTYPYRHAGAHMHMAVPRHWTRDDKLFFVKTCDLFLGLVDAYFFDSDDERLRRRIYGRAGECRFPIYKSKRFVGFGRDGKEIYEELDEPGVEYRVPCSQLWNDHRLSGLMFGVMRILISNQDTLRAAWKTEWEPEIQRQINECDVDPKWLQSVPSFYIPKLLTEIKKGGKLSTFNLLDLAKDWPNRKESPTSNPERWGYGNWVNSMPKTKEMFDATFKTPLTIVAP